MFKGWGTWLGIENTSTTEESEVADVAVEEKIVQDQNEVNKQHEPPATEELGQEDGDTVQLISQQAKGFGGKEDYRWFSFIFLWKVINRLIMIM